MPTFPCCKTIKGREKSRLPYVLFISSAFFFLFIVLFGYNSWSVEVILAVLLCAFVILVIYIWMYWICGLILACFNLLFPVACGHRKDSMDPLSYCFTGKCSKTLKHLLLTVESTVQTDNQLRETEQKVIPFLNDLKTELENKITPTTTFENIFVGSVAERYGSPYSDEKNRFTNLLKTDLDIMLCFQSVKASFLETTGVLIEPLIPMGIGFLGFANLRFMTTDSIFSSKDIIKQAKRAVGSTNTANFTETYPGSLSMIVKSPAITITNKPYEIDITMCVKCCEWPPFSDWPTRQRCWPSPDDVMRIVSLGCHLVPKPASSDKEQTSWRFSFSLAELELSKLVPKTARKCFLALKIILKYHLQPVCDIASYNIKNIFLNTLERTPANLWVDENIEQCFFILLKEVYDALLHGRCLHHWFRSVNLFAKIENPIGVKILIKKLLRIGENPAPFIFDDGCCCLLPYCTRLRLYDFPEQTRYDSYDEIVIVNEQVDDRTDQDVCCNDHSALPATLPSEHVDEIHCYDEIYFDNEQVDDRTMLI